MIAPLEAGGRLALAALVGAAIGIEREQRERAAGVRTFALVSLGAALFMLVSNYGFDDLLGVKGTQLDQSRVASGVVTGIGFLGDGTIVVQRGSVHGLTTAAGIWLSAALGIGCGGGLYSVVVIASVLAMLILGPIKLIEQRLLPRKRGYRVELVGRRRLSLHELDATLEAAAAPVRQLRIAHTPGARDSVQIDLDALDRAVLTALLTQLQALDGVDELITHDLDRSP